MIQPSLLSIAGKKKRTHNISLPVNGNNRSRPISAQYQLDRDLVCGRTMRLGSSGALQHAPAMTRPSTQITAVPLLAPARLFYEQQLSEGGGGRGNGERQWGNGLLWMTGGRWVPMCCAGRLGTITASVANDTEEQRKAQMHLCTVRIMLCCTVAEESCCSGR